MLRPLLAFLLLGTAALAQTPRDTPGADKVTEHTMALPGGPLAFTAEVDTIKLTNGQGQPVADVVTTAFTLKGVADAAHRPVTFVFNGGPGASSAWMDLGAAGPWRISFGNGTTIPSESPTPVPNPDTWLDATDLVFVDPPGTGYSRLTGKDLEKQVYSVNGDIDLLASVVRRWLETHNRLASPKFVAGESYGGFRGPLLAGALLDKQGVGVSGLILLSPVLDFNGRDSRWSPMRWVNTLPSMAAAARDATSRADLADVEAYARGDFLTDLMRGEGDPDAVTRLVTREAALIGLDPGLVRRYDGRVPVPVFLRERLPGRSASPYDATISTPDPLPAEPFDFSKDPLLDGMRAPMTTAMLLLYGQELQWHPDGWPARQYEVLDVQLARDWDYGRRMSRPEAYTALRQFLAVDPTAVVAVAHGLFDLVTPYFTDVLLLQQTPSLGPVPRLAIWTYPGGHMFYSRDDSRAALHRDVAALIQRALAARL